MAPAAAAAAAAASAAAALVQRWWRRGSFALAAAGSLIALGGQAAVTAATRDDPLRTPFWFAHVAFQGVALALAAIALVRPAFAAVPATAALACLVVLQFAFEAAGTQALLPSSSAWAAVIGNYAALAGNLLLIGAVGSARPPTRATAADGAGEGALPAENGGTTAAEAPKPPATAGAGPATDPGPSTAAPGTDAEALTASPPPLQAARGLAWLRPPRADPPTAVSAAAAAVATAAAAVMIVALVAGGWAGRDVMRGWTAGLQALAAAFSAASLAASPSGRFACLTGRGRLAAAGLAAVAAQAAVWQVWWPLAGTAAAAAAPAGAVGGGGGYLTFRGGSAAARAFKAGALAAAVGDTLAAAALGVDPPLPRGALVRRARPARVLAALVLAAAGVGVAICAVGTFDTSSTNDISPVGGRNPAWLAVLLPQVAALAVGGAALARPDWLARGAGGAACALAIPAGVLMLLAASPGVSGTIMAGLCLCAGGDVSALLALGFGGADPPPGWTPGGGRGRRGGRKGGAGGDGGDDGAAADAAERGATVVRRAAGTAADVSLEALLGAGSSGAVYRGRWHDTLVAVKVIKAAGAAAAAAAAAAAREGAVAAAKAKAAAEAAAKGEPGDQETAVAAAAAAAAAGAEAAAPPAAGDGAAGAAPARPPAVAPPPPGGGATAVEREARLSLSLQHPNVVATYDVIHVPMDGRGGGGGAGEDAAPAGGRLARLARRFVPGRRGRARGGSAADDDDDGTGPAPGELDETWIVLEYCDRGNLEAANRRGYLRVREPGGGRALTPGPGGGGGGAGGGSAATAARPASPPSSSSPPPAQPSRPAPDLAVIYACLRDIASGLAYLHSVGVVHGDVKPSNVLLKSLADDAACRGWVCKLADFGLSRVLDARATHMSTLNFGTLAFMPPELIRDGRCSPAADVYSLGMMMWELWAGVSAFAGVPAAALFYKVAFEGARPEALAGAPPEYAALMDACWAADPAARPTAAEVVRRLAPLAEAAAAARAAAAAPPSSAPASRTVSMTTDGGGVGGAPSPAPGPLAAGGRGWSTDLDGGPAGGGGGLSRAASLRPAGGPVTRRPSSPRGGVAGDDGPSPPLASRVSAARQSLRPAGSGGTDAGGGSGAGDADAAGAGKAAAAGLAGARASLDDAESVPSDDTPMLPDSVFAGRGGPVNGGGGGGGGGAPQPATSLGGGEERPNVFASAQDVTPVAPPISAFGSLAHTSSQAGAGGGGRRDDGGNNNDKD